MKQANDILENILHVVSRIDQRQARQESQTRGKGVGTISGNVGRVRRGRGSSAENIEAVSAAMPSLVNSVKELGKVNSKRATQGLTILSRLFDTFDKLGSPRRARNTDRAISTMHKMGTALSAVTVPLTQMATFLTKIAVGIVAFAGSLYLASKILSTTPLGTVAVIGLIITGMVGAFFLLAKVAPKMAPGLAAVSGMGAAMGVLSLGILAFALTIAGVGAIFGETGLKGTLMGFGVVAGIILGTVGAFMLLSKAAPFMAPGIAAVGGMAAAMGLLSLGIISLAITSRIVSGITGEPGKETKLLGFEVSPLIHGLGMVGAVILGAVGVFSLMGLLSKVLVPGIAAAAGMAAGMGFLSLGVLAVSVAARAVGAMAEGDGTTKKFMGYEVSPYVADLGTMGAVILGSAALFSILGLISAPVILGSVAALTMSLGMISLAAATRKFVNIAIGIDSLNQGLDKPPLKLPIMGGIEIPPVVQSLGTMGMVMLGAAGLFSVMGIASPLLLLGSVTALFVSLGMIALAGAARKFVDIGLGLDAMNADAESVQIPMLGITVPPVVGRMGTMGMVMLGATGLMAIMGLATPLVLPGVVTALALAGGLSLLGVAIKKVSDITKTYDVYAIEDNVSTMISGVLWGFIKGVERGLMGRDTGEDMNFFQKAGKAAQGIALLTGGIALVSGVAVSLSLFALTLRAFASVGKIAPIIGGTKENPVYGPAADVVTISNNIAQTISIFFKTLADLFREDGAMPKQEDISKMVNILMGGGGLRLFGFDVARAKPNLMDALYSFAKVLKFWGQFGENNEIPAGTDAQGNPIKPVKVTQVARNIAVALGAFMNGLSDEIINVGNTDAMQKKVAEMTYILLGKKSTGLLGLGKWLLGIPDKPGILEPVSKFADVIQQFASGRVMTGEYDDNGNPIWAPINYQATAQRIVSAIVGFTKHLSTGLSGITGGDAADKAGKELGKFEFMFEKLNTLSSASTGIDRVATSLNRVGDGLGLIADNIERMNIEKLNAVMGSMAGYHERTQDLPSFNQEAQQAPTLAQAGVSRSSMSDEDWEKISDMIGTAVGMQVSDSLKGGQFKFEFDTTKTGGVFYIEPS